MTNFSCCFKNIMTIHLKNKTEFVNPILHIHLAVIEGLRLGKGEVLLDYEFQILQLSLVKIVFSGGNVAFSYFAGFGGGFQPHIGETVICPIIYKLSRCLTTYCPKKFVLYFLEEFVGQLGFRVIIVARLVYILDLLIENFFFYSYFTDTVKKFLKVVHGTTALETLVIKGKTLDYIISKPLGSPNPELCALLGFNSITYGYNNIKAVISDGLVGIWNLQKMQIPFFVKFSFLEYIADMAGDNTYIPLKQFAHLSLCQPNGFIGKKYIYLYYAILGFVYYNFVIHNHIKTSAAGSCRDQVTLCDITSVAELNIFCESVINHSVNLDKNPEIPRLQYKEMIFSLEEWFGVGQECLVISTSKEGLSFLAKLQ